MILSHRPARIDSSIGHKKLKSNLKITVKLKLKIQKIKTNHPHKNFMELGNVLTDCAGLL